MKVLWLSHFLPHRATGHGALQRSHNLLLEAARRHEVHLVAVASGGDAFPPAALAEGVEALRSRLASVRAAGIARTPTHLRARQLTSALRSSVGRESFWDVLFTRGALMDTVRALASEGFDLVHADAVFLAPYLGAVGDVPLALNHHNIESDLLRRRAGAGGTGRRWFFGRQAKLVGRAEQRLARAAGINLVVSSLDGDRLRALAGDVAVECVPNGVDVDFFRPASGVVPQRGHLVFAGGMDWFPNREAMIHLARELWPALVADDPSRRMTVVGRSPPAALTERASGDPALRVTGFVDDVRPYISAASIYLCPITVGGGTRLKILDALAMSRPLVSTDLGVEGLDLQDGVHYLRANTTAEFITQVRRLEADPSLGMRLAQAGREFVERRYAWPVIGAALDAGWSRARKGAR